MGGMTPPFYDFVMVDGVGLMGGIVGVTRHNGIILCVMGFYAILRNGGVRCQIGIPNMIPGSIN